MARISIHGESREVDLHDRSQRIVAILSKRMKRLGRRTCEPISQAKIESLLVSMDWAVLELIISDVKLNEDRLPRSNQAVADAGISNNSQSMTDLVTNLIIQRNHFNTPY